MEPVAKLVGHIPVVNKIAGGIEEGFSKVNKLTHGVLGGAWNVAKEIAPILPEAGPIGEIAAVGIEGGSQAQEFIHTAAQNQRKRSIGSIVPQNYQSNLEEARGKVRIY
ncbi:MAG: hypothetical protein A2W11_11960 [Ignavibacteria bacterium RBG_16_35_7]|nr:MAG: hypothetical protein A2W11_11960 [Ignavibacteria bacterium RBG_16_35_7]